MQEESRPQPEELLEMHATVQGYVQGVGFRASTRYLATGLGLTGIVRNLPGGNVEIYAQGSRLNLDRFLHLLKSQAGGRVDAITTRYFSPHQIYDGFRIVH